MLGRLRLRAAQDVAERDQLPPPIRHLDADRRLPRDRGEDAHVGCRQRIRDVVREARDLGDLHTGRELDLVSRHGRPGDDAGQPGIHAVLEQRLFQLTSRLIEDPFAVVGATTEREELHRWFEVGARR